ncbi:MAG TPA: hypothetical protein VG964_03745 [Candidatus Saccharimonadales bacterium]|nr:hypothetical protein [Candidatus Saccharimonadales bacterium]
MGQFFYGPRTLTRRETTMIRHVFGLLAAAIAAAALLACIKPEQVDARSAVAATAARHCGQVRSVIGHRSKSPRALASANIGKAKSLCAKTHGPIHTISFWNKPKLSWTLYKNYQHYTCWDLRRKHLLQGPEALCMVARGAVRISTQKLVKLDRKIAGLLYDPGELAIRHDLVQAGWRRSCIAGVETNHSPRAYSEESPGGKYKGKYQYDNGTWQAALKAAESYYNIEISNAYQADEASPWAQDVVTSFAVLHHGQAFVINGQKKVLLGWDPWQECR